MKKAAIICARGLGDGLLMMIVAHHMRLSRYHTVLFHNGVQHLSPLFKNVSISPHPPLEALKEIFQDFDRVIIENDHSKRAYTFAKLRRESRLASWVFFFPTPSPLFQKGDFVFNPKLPAATNLCMGCQMILDLKHATKANGIAFPKKGLYRIHSKRVVIHPTSGDCKRNWRASQFLLLAQHLQSEGYEIGFSMSMRERHAWIDVEYKGFQLPKFADLGELSMYLYESGFFIGNDSGIGHLASNLGIPTLTIAGNSKRSKLWRPGWMDGHVVTPPFPLPNFKGIGLRIREHMWQRFVPVSRVLKAFHKLKQFAV